MIFSLSLINLMSIQYMRFTGSFRQALESRSKVFPTNCKFSQRKCIFLGHEISTEGFKPPNDGLESISEYPLPKNVKALRRFKGS